MKTLSTLFEMAVVGAACCALTVGCAHAKPEGSAAASDPLGASSAQVAAEVVEPEQTPQQLLSWAIEVVNQGGELASEDIEQRFAPEFLRELPVAKVQATFKQLAERFAPIALKQESEVPPNGAVALLETKAGPMRAEIALSGTTPRKITLLGIMPWSEPAKSYDEARALLQKAGDKSSLLVAEVVDGRCKPQQASDERDSLAIGSAFKLWVLLALDTKMRADKSLTWNSKIVIDDKLKSFPSGELQDTPAGTEVSLREAANKMIAISDNTAADHITQLVGREAVERAQRDAKHARPEANIPWLTTRELFALKLQNDDAELAAYRGANVAAKRKLLAGLASRPLDPNLVAGWTSPRALDIEWFASTSDLCNVMATLGGRAQFEPESELLQALSQSTGIPIQDEAFKYVGFKGGSEPGVMSLAWLVQRNDGRWFVVAMTVNDTAKALDDQAILSAAEGVLKLVRD